MTGLSHLADMLEIPVAGGEHQYDLAAFKTLLHSYAVDIAIIALAHVGGMIPWRRIAGPAAALHVPVCGRVIPEVHAHLLAAIPNAYRVEDVPRSAPILPAMPNLGYGCLVAPQAPGLGPALDEVAVSRHRVG